LALGAAAQATDCETIWRTVFGRLDIHKWRPTFHVNLLGGQSGWSFVFCVQTSKSEYRSKALGIELFFCFFSEHASINVEGLRMETPHDSSLPQRQVDKIWAWKNKIPLSYQISTLTQAMVGSGDSPVLKTKAAETAVLMRWATEFCDEVGARLPHGEVFSAAGQCLIEYMSILKESPFKLPWATCSRLMFLCLRHLKLMQSTGNRFQPKAHMWVHMTQKCVSQGNPREYSCFLDESLNLVLAGMAASSHRSQWERGIFLRARLLPTVCKDAPFAVFR
jgi:hypothetical protein